MIKKNEIKNTHAKTKISITNLGVLEKNIVKNLIEDIFSTELKKFLKKKFSKPYILISLKDENISLEYLTKYLLLYFKIFLFSEIIFFN